MSTLILLILVTAWRWWWYFELRHFALKQGYNCKGFFKRQLWIAILFSIALLLFAFYLFFIQGLRSDEWF